MGNGSTSVHAVAVAAAELGRGEWSFGRPVADAIVVVLFVIAASILYTFLILPALCLFQFTSNASTTLCPLW